jgi:hypothetical protein
MQYINGIPLIWDEVANNKLLGRVFPAGLPAAPPPAGYGGAQTFEGIMDNNPLGKQSIFYTPIIMDDKDGTFEKVGDIPLLAIGFGSIEPLKGFLLGQNPSENGRTITGLLKNSPIRIVCAYLRNTSSANAENLVFVVVGDVLEYINSSTITGYIKQMLPILSAAGQFAFTEPQVKKAFEQAMPFTLHELSFTKKISKEQSQLYKNNFDKLNALVEDAQDPATKSAILLLCQTLLESNIDVLQTYNQQPDVRYDAAYPKRKLTATDILYMARRIRQLQEMVTKFQKGDFELGQDVTDFVNEHFVDPSALGTATRYIIKYPFEKLGYEIRMKLVLQLLSACEFALSGFYDPIQHIGEQVSHWDVLYNLLTTGTEADRLKLVMELEENDLVFELLYYAKNDEFLFNISVELSNLLLSSLSIKDDKQKEGKLIMQGNYTYFSMDLAKKQEEELVVDEARILLENKGFWNLGKYLLPKKEAAYEDKVLEQYLDEYASYKILFKPLDLMVVFAEQDINAGFIKIAAGESVVLPACIVYLLFKIDTNRAKDFITALTTTLIFLPFGISGLIGAIRAANSLGIIVSAVDISVDAAYLTYTSPSIQNSDLREDLEFINTLAAIYGLARLSYSLGSLKNAKGKQLLKDVKTAVDSLKKEGKLLVGSGGNLKYLKVVSRNVIAQEEPMSCAAACIRQLAKDEGITKLEDAVRKAAGTTDLGTTDKGILIGLQEVFENREVIGRSFYKNADHLFPSIAKDISKEGKWLGTIHPANGPKHAVIIDKIIGNKVYIRDPWPIEGIGMSNFGVEAVVDLKEFSYAWLKGGAVSFHIK